MFPTELMKIIVSHVCIRSQNPSCACIAVSPHFCELTGILLHQNEWLPGQIQGEREDTGEAPNSHSEGATGVGLGANVPQVTAQDPHVSLHIPLRLSPISLQPLRQSLLSPVPALQRNSAGLALQVPRTI